MNMGHCNDNKKQENNKLLEEYMSRCHFLLHKSHMVCSSTEFRPLRCVVWRPDVYHLLHICHVYNTDNVKLLASGCSLPYSLKFLGGRLAR